MMWLYLALLSTLLFAITNIIDKYVVTEFIRRPLFNTILSGVVVFLGGLAVLIFNGVYVPGTWILALSVASGCLLVLANYFFFRGILSEEISRAMPILISMAPLFIIVIAAVLLGEVLLPVQYMGIGLLLVSSVLISVRKTTRITLSAALWIMIAAAILYASKTIITKYVLGYMDFWSVFFWMSVGALISSLAVLSLYRRTFLVVIGRFRRPVLYSSVSEVLSTAATFIFVAAISFGPVSLVSSVDYTQPAFVLLFATLLSIYRPQIIREELKSSVLGLKMIAIGIMVVGMFLIA